MGNAVVSNLGDGLATAAVAKYVRLTKDQVRLLQRSLRELADNEAFHHHFHRPSQRKNRHNGRSSHHHQHHQRQQRHHHHSNKHPSSRQRPRNRYVSRPLFQIAVLSRAKIRPTLEARLLDRLFTMWDTDGTDRILYPDLIVALAPLACPGESLGQVLQFCLQVMDFDQNGNAIAGEDNRDDSETDDDDEDDMDENADEEEDDSLGILAAPLALVPRRNRSRNSQPRRTPSAHLSSSTVPVVTAAQLLRVLQNVNKLVASFGDCALSDRQIHKVVDGIFDTITLISDDDETDVLTHDECVDRLLQEPLIQKLAFNKLRDYNEANGSGQGFPEDPANNTPSPFVATTFVTRHSTLVMAAPPRQGMAPSPRSLGAPTHATVAAPSPRSYYTHPSTILPGSALSPTSLTSSHYYYGGNTPHSSAPSTPHSYGTGYTSGPSGTYNSAGDTYTYSSAGGITYYTENDDDDDDDNATGTTGATPLYSLPVGAASLRSPRTPPAPRFFRYDNPSPRKTYIPDDEPFGDGTRLDEESLLTDVSSHFLTPLAYMVPVHNTLSDELVSL